VAAQLITDDADAWMSQILFVFCSGLNRLKRRGLPVGKPLLFANQPSKYLRNQKYLHHL
jgi:hypothetical protein